MAASDPENTTGNTPADSAKSSATDIRYPSLLPETPPKVEVISVVKSLSLPASHIEHISLGTRLFHRVEAVAGIALVKAAIHGTKRHKIHSELNQLEADQQKFRLTPEGADKMIKDVLALNDHARQNEVQAALKALQQENSGKGSPREKGEAEQMRDLQARRTAALAVLGLPPEPAPPGIAQGNTAHGASSEVPSDVPADFTIHKKHFGQSEMETIKHIARSFGIVGTNDPFTAFVRSHPELIKRQAEMDEQAKNMSPEQRQAAEDRFLSRVAEDWNNVDASDRDKAIDFLGARDSRSSGLRERVVQVEAVAAQVTQLRNSGKPAKINAAVYMDPATAFSPIVPGLSPPAREK